MQDPREAPIAAQAAARAVVRRGYRLEAMDPTKSPRLLDSRQQSFTEVPMRLIGVALYLLSHRVRAFAPVARS